MSDCIVILDFGSQYTQLIARRIRELNVYCEIYPFNHIPPIDDSVKGIILSGSPSSVHDAQAPTVDLRLFGDLPVLAICYGAQLIAHQSGGLVLPSQIREYGKANLQNVSDHPLFEDVSVGTQVWMSHGDTIAVLPPGFEAIASTDTVPVAAYWQKNTKRYGLQFHPEVTHTVDGKKILQNFIIKICGCAQTWTAHQFVETTIKSLQQQLGNDRVVMALSGGVDSTVAAMLIHQAIGPRLFCIFVDNGLLRKHEFDEVLNSYRKMELNIKGVDARDKFYAALRGVSEPEAKRKAIGKTFIEVFDKEAHRLKDIAWLGQGTIYPDVIESVSVKGPSVTIKSHHNVGGLPETMKMKVVEPLRALFKDEVRQVGRELLIDEEILGRHPFPGPGLGIRIIGEVTPERIRILQEADHIFIAKLRAYGWYYKIWQAGVILLPVYSVGVMGDERTYEQVAALRAVLSVDGMTADWSQIPYHILGEISSAIINQVKGINRVVYDISSKPPATIEWE